MINATAQIHFSVSIKINTLNICRNQHKIIGDKNRGITVVPCLKSTGYVESAKIRIVMWNESLNNLVPKRLVMMHL